MFIRMLPRLTYVVLYDLCKSSRKSLMGILIQSSIQQTIIISFLITYFNKNLFFEKDLYLFEIII